MIRKSFSNPTKYPAVFHFRGQDDQGDFDVVVSDELGFIGLKMNSRSLDGPALKAIPERRDPLKGVTVDQLKAVLLAGATWREPRPLLVNEFDGAEAVCAYCSSSFQPVKYPGQDRDDGNSQERGNVLVLKLEVIKARQAELSNEYGENAPDLLTAAERHTREVIGLDAVMPGFIRALFVCRTEIELERRKVYWNGKIVKEGVFRTYLSRAAAAEEILGRNTRIRAATIREALNRGLGSKRSDPRSRRDAYQKFGVAERQGGSRNRPDRPEKPKAVFSGTDGSAEFEAGTVEAFAKAGVTTLAEIAAASNERLAQIGAISSPDHEPAAKSVRFRAQSALERSVKADVAANAANQLSVPLPLPKIRDRKPPAGRQKTGRKGKRFQRTEEDDGE